MAKEEITVRERLAFAADVPLDEAVSIYGRVSQFVGVVKVGLSLFVEHGPEAVKAFVDLKARVFLDLKIHDIPNTVELAAARAAGFGVSFLTVHASGGRQMLEAAVRGAKVGAGSSSKAPPLVLAVTVLTSLDEGALAETGVVRSASEQVNGLGLLAVQAGVDGLVCSAKELLGLRSALGRRVFLCTPGIRPAGAAAGDQARVETPRAACLAGSDLLVVGRPIYEARDPAVAAAAIAAEVEAAQAGGPRS